MYTLQKLKGDIKYVGIIHSDGRPGKERFLGKADKDGLFIPEENEIYDVDDVFEIQFVLSSIKKGQFSSLYKKAHK